MAGIFDRLATFVRSKQIQRAAGFAELVKQIADGKEPDPAHVDSLLVASGRTLDDLKAAVDALTRRRALRGEYDAGRAVDAERAKVETKIAAARAELDAAQQRFDAAVAPLHDRLRHLERTEDAARRAGDELRKSCTDPVRLERYNAAVRALEANAAKRDDLAEKKRRCETEAAACASRASRAFVTTTGTAAPRHEDEAAEWRAKAEKYAAEITAALAEHDQLLAARDAAEAALLDV